MNKYLILPSSSDLNRGDQALVWETVEVAKDAGYNGDYYMISSEVHKTSQSQSQGLKILTQILKHPSRKSKTKENTDYNFIILLKWGFVALFDFLGSAFLLNKFTRFLATPFLSIEDKKTLNVMKECDACFVKGGGFIHSSGKITDTYTVYYQLFHILLAKSLKKPVYIMPNSFGPFPGLGVERMVRHTFNKCELVTVRESISKTMLDEIGVKSYLYPDLGFSLKEKNRENYEINKIHSDFPNHKLVGFTARPYRFPKSSDPEKKYAEYIDSIIEISKWLFEEGYLPVFIEQTLSETTHENDGTAIEEIVSKLVDKQYAIVSDDSYDCKDLKSIYKEMDYVIGTRFHSVIFSIAERTPAIAIEYGGNKGEGILRDMNLSKCGIAIEDISFSRLKESFEYVLENEKQILGKMDAYNQHVKNKRLELVNRLRNK